MSDPRLHHWFESTTGVVSIMSHNGSAERPWQLGTTTAFRRAYRAGYRWFQVDALPIKDDLVSCHALFGRKIGYRSKDRAEVADLLPDVPTLYELLTDDAMPGALWNIEMKSATGLPALLALLERLQSQGWDLRRIMVSSPPRPKVVKAVAARFPDVAVAAPVVHGGVFGVRFLGARRATTVNGPYDCQQCFHLFVRSGPSTDRRPPRQAWTIGNRRTLDRVLRAGAFPIVTAHALTIRCEMEGPGRAPLPVSNPQDRHDEVAAQLFPGPRALALGGGGWRGAFGGIGAVMYFAHRGMLAGIDDIVGISGGAFTVAALSQGQEPEAATSEPATSRGAVDGEQGDEPEVAALRRLLEVLDSAGHKTRSILGLVAASVVGLVALVVLALLNLWRGGGRVSMLWVFPVLFLSSLLLRLIAATRWRWILNGVFGSAVMGSAVTNSAVTSSAVTGSGPASARSASAGSASSGSASSGSAASATPGGRSRRRYAIGATGLADGRLYSFTSDPAHDVPRWRADRTLATPLAGHKLAHVVGWATALPGLGEIGLSRVWLPTCDHGLSGPAAAAHHDRRTCDEVHDRLVDGGVSGIFGRGLIRPVERRPGAAPIDVVVVDAGRRLPAEAASLGCRLTRFAQRASALVLLSRWLMVSLDVAYRNELRVVRDANVIDGHRYRLVRLAEEEDLFDPVTGTVPDASRISLRRRDDLNRLYVLRDQVHQFSLMRVSDANTNRTIAAAVAACALEFEHEPDIPRMLASIGHRLGRGDQLANVWDDVRVPLLGQPVELGPPQVRCPEPVDHRPAAFEMVFNGM